MCVYVSAPEAMNNLWRDMKSERPIKQVLLLFSLFTYMTLAINITDGCGLSNEVRCKLLLKKEQGNAVLAFLFTVNRLTSCTLLTRRSVSALKVGMTCGFQSL